MGPAPIPDEVTDAAPPPEDPYAPPTAPPVEAPEASVGWFVKPRLNRVNFVLVQLALGLVESAVISFLDEGTVEAVSGLVIAANVLAGALRLQDVGVGFWWAGTFLVPVLNVFTEFCCLALPTNYARTRRLDVAAKIVFAFCGVLFAVAAFLALKDRF